MKNYQKYFLISAVVIIIDQFVKLLVKFNLTPGTGISVIQNRLFGFNIHFLENDGAAFGVTIADLFNHLGANMSDETGKLILSLFSVFAVCIIGVVLYQVSQKQSLLPLFVSFIFGGAIGNIIDRVFYGILFSPTHNWFSVINDYEGGLLHGKVVDMFYVNMGVVHLFGQPLQLWPVFNIADAAISIGIIAILIFQKDFFNAEAEKTTTETPPTPVVETKEASAEDVATQA